MKLIYFNQNIKLPKAFNHPDVIVEIPFDFGYVNYFPYYNQAEAVVDFDKISKFEKMLITNQSISHAACEALNKLNEETVYNFIFVESKEAANRALKYEFEDLYFKLISLAKEKTKLFGKLQLDNIYCETSLNEFSVKFDNRKFFFVLKQNEDGKLVTSTTDKRTSGPVSYQDIQNFKQLLNENLDKFTVIA